MYQNFQKHLQERIDNLERAGLYKHERVIQSRQGAHMDVLEGEVINLCANNYLGMAENAEVHRAAKEALERWGYGMASVRFICGTLHIHKQLELALSAFLGCEDSILFPSCFDANGGLFESLLGAQDAVISDQLNHASIIDGIRLCKAQRYRYKNNDMADLEKQLQAACQAGTRFRMISTDGVFSMDGSIAHLQQICDLADSYGALVHVDDSHGVGCLGSRGRGSHEYCGVIGRVDVMTGTLGKALGGASGGYTSGKQEIVSLLRQSSRPYLFSNTVSPPVVAGSLKALQMLSSSTELLDKLKDNTKYFRGQMQYAGFDLTPGVHPICPVMFYDAVSASQFAEKMLAQGVYVIAFSFPVVAKDQARIRAQVSAAHSREDLDKAIAAFKKVRDLSRRK